MKTRMQGGDLKARIFKNCTVELFYRDNVIDPEFICVHTEDHLKDFDIRARIPVPRLKIDPDDKEDFLREDDEK